jgi:hypothetical protein
MILLLILIILVFVLAGIFAAQNPGSHNVAFGPYHWNSAPDWLPVVAAAAIVAVLFLLYMAYSGMLTGIRHGFLRRRISSNEATINDLRTENERLREENARLRADARRGGRTGETVSEPSASPSNGQVVNSRNQPEGEASDTTGSGPTFSERVRAFFNRKESSGY